MASIPRPRISNDNDLNDLTRDIYKATYKDDDDKLGTARIRETILNIVLDAGVNVKTNYNHIDKLLTELNSVKKKPIVDQKARANAASALSVYLADLSKNIAKNNDGMGNDKENAALLKKFADKYAEEAQKSLALVAKENKEDKSAARSVGVGRGGR
jgi:uncharacterized protein YjgD (DUF1641 family)